MFGHSPTGSPLVLVAGGGVAALEAALALRRLAGDRVDVELVATEPAFRHRPLAVAEPFGSAPVESVDLERFAAEHGFRFRVGALVSVEPDRRLARTRDGESIPYDALVVACGAEPLPALPGALTSEAPPMSAPSGSFSRRSTRARSSGSRSPCPRERPGRSRCTSSPS